MCRLFNEFEAHVEKIVASGNTRLFDALQDAGQRLVEFRREHPAARLRILCLTDGEDTGSSVRPHDVAQYLQMSGIVVDSMVIGGTDNKPLIAISTVTGGQSHQPASITAALQILEEESMISLSERGADAPAPQPVVSSLSELLSFAPSSSSSSTCRAVTCAAPAPRAAPQLSKPAVSAATMVKQLASAPASTPRSACIVSVALYSTDCAHLTRLASPRSWQRTTTARIQRRASIPAQMMCASGAS